PVAVQAALAVLGALTPGAGGRRIFVLGDMRELGESGPVLHAALAGPVLEHRIERLHTVGPLTQHLRAALPSAILGHHAAKSEELAPMVAADIRAGDVVTVKGSLGTNMAPIVTALKALDAGAHGKRGG